MQIHTKYFGRIEVSDHELITFPHGIPGFIEENEFVLLPLEGNTMFQVLQATSGTDPAFIVVNPFLFVSDYEFDIDPGTLELLNIQSEKDVQVWSIISLKNPFESSTANLQAPIIVNQNGLLAKQYVTNLKEFSTREALFLKQRTSQVKED